MKEGFNVIEEIQVSSNFENLSQIESLIDRSCAEAGVDEDNYGNVLIAVTEAFNNAVVHGNKNDNSKKVKVKVGHSEEELCFVLEDEGLGFDYENVADPTAPENIEKEHGRGIYLMRHLADLVEFENRGKEVSVFFKKNA
jgi:serine/threonine-protein kinase RsbW